MDIGEKLRQLRLQRGLTQEEMADRCELSKGFISQVERNLASPLHRHADGHARMPRFFAAGVL